MQVEEVALQLFAQGLFSDFLQQNAPPGQFREYYVHIEERRRQQLADYAWEVAVWFMADKRSRNYATGKRQ